MTTSCARQGPRCLQPCSLQHHEQAFYPLTRSAAGDGQCRELLREHGLYACRGRG